MSDETDNVKVDMDAGMPHQDDLKEQNLVVTWSNRRQMAWTALFSIDALIVAVLFFIPQDKVVAFHDIITSSLWVFFSIIGSYFGFTSMPFWGYANRGRDR